MDIVKIKATLAEWKERLEGSEGADEIAFCNRRIEKLEEELLLAHAGVTIPQKKDNKPKAKKAATKKQTHEPDPFEHEGKTYVFGVDEDYCTILRKQWAERQKAVEKSQHKYKTKSLSLKIADGIKHPIKNVINSITDAEINKNPKRLLVKLRSLKKNAKALLADCKSIAPQLTQKDINGPIAVIEDMIEEIEESIGGEKKVDGGGIEKKGKTREQIWKDFSVDQRISFLNEHKSFINKEYAKEHKNTKLNVEKWATNLYSELPEAIKMALYNYDYFKQYANGGGVDADQEQMANGYMDAVLFTEVDNNEESLDSNYSRSDFSAKAVAAINKMIKKYITDNKEAIEKSKMDVNTIGNDIWYTQSGQGAGFFDHSLDKEIEDKLTNAAKSFGSPNAEVGDDGKIYINGLK